MAPNFNAKAYRNAYRKARYQRKPKVINYKGYTSWKNPGGLSYKKFTCRECNDTTECYNFYIGHLRYCLMKRNLSLLVCKRCHNHKKKNSISKSLQGYKVKSSPEDTIPPSIKEWLRKEKGTTPEKNMVPSPAVIATLNNSNLSVLATSPLDTPISRISAHTLSDISSP